MASTYRLDDFHYDLPENLIAQRPLFPRHKAKLLWDKEGGFHDSHIENLCDILPKNSVFIVNNTKTLPALLQGYKVSSAAAIGAKISINLHQFVAQDASIWHVFIKGLKKIQQKDIIFLDEDLQAEVLSKEDDGSAYLKFNLQGEAFFNKLDQIGAMPLPPYIKRTQKDAQDFTDYQTAFAKEKGAIAAPTASLHFDDMLIKKCKEHGVIFEEITLHVGAGTFLPVRSQNLSHHKMHKEYAVLNENVAKRLNAYKQEKRCIITVGTTSLRTCESAAHSSGILEAFHGETDIFIKPGYKFKFCEHLLTNFHLPKSTLLMLVAAFIGYKNMQALYQHAIENKYRFFSYGDACLLTVRS